MANRLRQAVAPWLALALLAGPMLFAGMVLGGAARAQPVPVEPRRIALVIGNIDYQSHEKLPNVANDVSGMKQVLERLNFTVTAPPQRRTMSELVIADILPFADTIEEGDIVVVYYSGHGFSYGGESYLVPIGAPATVKASKVRTTFPPISAIQSLLEEHKPGLVLMVFDACRTIGAFVEADPATGVSKGFGVELNPVSNMWIAYGSAPGLAAGAGVAGDRSVFTRALIRRLATPGKELAEIQRMIRFDVQAATGTTQNPWYSDGRTVNLWLVPTDAVRTEELTQWQAHLALGTADAIREFLAFYGVGSYAAAARARLAAPPDGALAAAGTVPTSVPAVLPEAAWQPGASAVRVARFASLDLPATADVSAASSLADIRGAVGRDALAFATKAVARKPVTIDGDVPSAIDPTVEPWLLVDGEIIVTGSNYPSRPASPRQLVKGSVLLLGQSFGGPRTASIASEGGAEDVTLKLKSSEVALGRPTAELLVDASVAGAGVTVDPTKVTAALAQAKAGGRKVSWVSIATARADGNRATLQRRLLATHARFVVTEAGVPGENVTLVNGLPETFEGVRLRIYTR